MRKPILRYLGGALLSLLFVGCGHTEVLQEKLGMQYRSPLRFEKEIIRFEEADQLAFPEKGGILFLGSSSMRLWQEAAQDFTPLSIIKRGFGGSNMNDALHYCDRIVLPYAPRAIVLYEGENDLWQGMSIPLIMKTFRDFFGKVHGSFPECRFYVLSVKPSPKRWGQWGKVSKLNTHFQRECEKDERLTYVDVSQEMLNEEGLPKAEIFLADQLHMNREGYLLWKKALLPLLLEKELPFE